MKTSTLITVALVAPAAAFSGTGSFTGSQISAPQNSATMSMEYIPSGMSKDQWRKMKEAEKNKNKGKNLGKSGITSFKSRSFADWQKAGGKNLFPVDPKSVKSVKDLPFFFWHHEKLIKLLRGLSKPLLNFSDQTVELR